MAARVHFFQAYIAVLIGGMKATLGEDLTKSTIEHLTRSLNGEHIETRPRLH